jgi:hypothetical protein
VKESGRYEARWIDEVRVKGRGVPVKLYQVINRSLGDLADQLVATRGNYEAALIAYQNGDLIGQIRVRAGNRGSPG